MTTLTFFLLTLAVAAARPSHFSLDGGHGGYGGEPKLISQSVHLREIPTKIIKVTKTAVIKVPVPYPVKVPHHIPVPVPVNHPVAIPYTKFVKVPEQVPVEVPRPVPIEITQQVPLLVPKTIALTQPVPVPHPVHISKPVYYPVPHPIPYQAESHEGGHYASLGDGDHVGHESERYAAYTVNEQAHGYDQDNGDHGHFQPSQPDYSAGH